HRRGIFRLEVAPRDGIGKSEPSRRRDGRRVVDRVDLVLARQAVGDNVELQLPHCAEEQRIVPAALEHLDRTLLAELAQSFLQLLGLEWIARPRGPEQLRREIWYALVAEGLAFCQRMPDLQPAAVVVCGDVAGT